LTLLISLMPGKVRRYWRESFDEGDVSKSYITGNPILSTSLQNLVGGLLPSEGNKDPL
jgi:hypothetical protein